MKTDNLEVQILLKNIKNNNKLIQQRNKTREEIMKRKDERDKKMEEVLRRNEQLEFEKKNKIKKRQMSRDVKNIQRRYNILKPMYDDKDIYYNNENIKNKKIGNQIQVFSTNRRTHLNEVKNKFYESNNILKPKITNGFNVGIINENNNDNITKQGKRYNIRKNIKNDKKIEEIKKKYKAHENNEANNKDNLDLMIVGSYHPYDDGMGGNSVYKGNNKMNFQDIGNINLFNKNQYYKEKGFNNLPILKKK